MLFGIEVPSSLLIGAASVLLAVAGAALLGHAVVGQREAVARRVDRLALGLPDRVAAAAAMSIRFMSPTNPVGTGMSLATGGTHGLCAYAATNAGLGDQGFCTPECDSAADCPDKTDMAICDLSEMANLGHGICSFP